MKYRTIIITKSADEIVGASEEAEDLRRVAEVQLARALQTSRWLTIDVDHGVAMVPIDHIATVFVVEDVPPAEDKAPAEERIP
ncbi:hypothetical protein Aph01nite_43920 [Acrocarpospora phusangensis]|uniref:Uncharacterized protein n=1 Tax=Acrocarpospora phusangensis TaxID=1070424 RepID=A0A919QH23_9ACTN|nr:hypothetical protein [Acrocarpospora phusangensis]GIH26082.1 hypothetical protein Aph01nite_43920 [Acrocarpospora phusangensis]